MMYRKESSETVATVCEIDAKKVVFVYLLNIENDDKYNEKVTKQRRFVTFSVAGVVRLELTARGFGELTSASEVPSKLNISRYRSPPYADISATERRK